MTFAAASTPVSAPSSFEIDAAAAGFDPVRLERITDHLNRRYVDPQKIAGCQVLVARHGHVAYFRSLGLSNIERSTPMADDALFRIYSMTKPITSVALMSLFEQGHFQLNDPVSRFIPAWKDHQVWVSGAGADMVVEPPRRPMTVRDLLCHTSGLTYGSLLANVGAAVEAHPVEAEYERVGVRRGPDETIEDMVNQLAQVPLRFHPGERWMYSLATDVCGRLVEVMSGQRLDEFLSEHIFKPLGMVDTGFRVLSEKVGRLTANYVRRKDKRLVCIDDPETSTYLQPSSFFSGGGGLVSTTADYFRFTEMLRRGGEVDGARILGARTIDLMRRNHLVGGSDLVQLALGSFSETAYSGVGFGLGFATTLDSVSAGALGAGDFYWGGAASTIFWVDPVEDLEVIFMTQLMPSATFDFRGQLKNIVYSSIVG